jgi:ribonucleotide monophosphatase NagD (HAD superfamily)
MKYYFTSPITQIRSCLNWDNERQQILLQRRPRSGSDRTDGRCINHCDYSLESGKPDPEVYLLAASRVGVAAERCIVVEDASAGIEGGRRAGMRSIGVSHNCKDLHADLVVQSLELLEPDAFDRLLSQTK